MKRLFCLLCAVLMLASAIIVPAAAEGMTFGENDKYKISRPFDTAPISVEAWVCLPVGAGRAGVVVGNFSGSAPCINFEITTNGRPRMYVVEYTSGAKAIHDVTFKSVDVRTGESVHVAITHDKAKAETYCYVDGVLKETIAGALNITDEVLNNPFMLGGDLRSGNAQYFKYEIEDVAIYSDTRGAEEIKAAMKAVDTADSNLIAYYNTAKASSAIIKDESNNGYHVGIVKKWLDDKEPVTDYAYSFCVVGDTQVVTEHHPDKLACIYDWIIDNKDEKKIEFVFGMGDITNKNTDEEWTVAKAQIDRLNGVVPYSIVRGNHDGTEKINRCFANPQYMSQFGGFYDENKIDNSWRVFSVGNTDYLLVNLDFGPSDALLDWASGIIEAHPAHKVIITTHCYLYRDGTTLDAGDVAPPNKSGANDGARNNGDQMWDKLVSKHENIFLVLSGHDPSSDVVATQTKGVNGNVVTQMLVDAQGVDSAEGPTGMIAMLYFSKDGKTLAVEQYSTVRDMYYMNTSQFTLPLPDDFHMPEAELDDSEKPPVETAPAETAQTETQVSDADVTDEPLPVETQKAPNVGADIGIIGGADGPTAIFIAGQIWPLLLGPVVVVAAIGVAIGIFIGRKRK